MSEIRCRRHPRVGLLGNPSDGYSGRTIAFTFRDFSAEAVLSPKPSASRPVPPNQIQVCAGTPLPDPRDPSLDGGAALLLAAWTRFQTHCQQQGLSAPDPGPGFTLGFRTSIPRQVGLSGSSAIILAALGCLTRHFTVAPSPLVLADLALRAETDDLGLSAGPMDRLVQAHGGLVHMDHSTQPNRVTALDAGLLPPLFIAWDPTPGESSGVIHSQVRARWIAGDPEVQQAMRTFAHLSDSGLGCLQRSDFKTLAALLDQSFDLRSAFWTLRAVDHQLVGIGRAAGAGVKFAGSGGAVVGLLPSEEAWPELVRAYQQAGLAILRPTLGPVLAHPQRT